MAYPTDEPSPDERAETSRALRWVLGCVVAVLAIYGAISLLVTDDAYFTRLGRVKEVDFVLRDVRDFDRAEAVGNAPVVWIVGSSIARETFDAEAIEARLAQAGSDHRVVKFAFNRGAPIFTQAIVDDLPVRPGDRVVTSIAEGNFRWSWLEEAAAFDKYVQAILSPAEILALGDVALPNQLEWSLGSTPPSAFYRNQTSYRRGLWKTIRHWTGGRKPRMKRHVSYQPFTDSTRSLSPKSTQDWTLPPDEVVLAPGQTNYDGLRWLVDDLADRRVDLTVVYVPGHPRLYERFVELQTVVAVQDHFEGWPGLDYHRLAPRRGRAYQDYKHPNNRGRAEFSRDLADLLIAEQGLAVPPRAADEWQAGEGDLPDDLLQRLQP